MQIDASVLARIAGKPVNSNMESVIAGLKMRGTKAGLGRPHRLAHYLAQLGHESAGFHYDREIWGPTPAQRGYEGREDLGNTQPGDGSKFRGRTGGQITGRGNYRRFTAWAREADPAAPDFVAHPELINTDPWEGLGPIWYWEIGNPTGRPLSRYADENDAEMITRRWNGGLNGYADRLRWYTRAGLVLLGFGPDAVREFQAGAGVDVDGISGPRTRAAIHAALLALPEASEPVLPRQEIEAALMAARALVERLEPLLR